MLIKFAVKLVRRKVYTHSDDLDLQPRSQLRLKVDTCFYSQFNRHISDDISANDIQTWHDGRHACMAYIYTQCSFTWPWPWHCKRGLFSKGSFLLVYDCRLRSDRVRIHEQLALAIIAVQILFLIGVGRTAADHTTPEVRVLKSPSIT